ncbi:hypothetical protein PSTG_01812 [Puccinia striiformis f. sp. tritici PST-78]|uniref:Uncharacterized protein n=1 Tax=Puccinia striiformis f. sp. tritici PST-78 TaxID=1165861 RepID=A0A0L0W107_9BASI|nr:hypothetical protein PSTG_01812 [Puccinia striiformis f. sp. tritici PST-78]
MQRMPSILPLPANSSSHPNVIDDIAERPPAAARTTRAKRPRRPSSNAVVRTPRVALGEVQSESLLHITPSRIITDSRSRPRTSTVINRTPIPTNQHVPGLQGVSDMAIDPLFQPPIIAPAQAPIITPSRIIPSDGDQAGFHAALDHLVPPEPNSEDEIDPPSGHNTSKDEAFSVYGSLDGFIRPPPPQQPVVQPPTLAMNLPPPPTPSVARPSLAASVPRAPRVTTDPLVESMLASAQLLETDLQLTTQLFNAPEDTRWKLSVIMWLRQRPTQPVASQIITPNGAGPHVYGTIIRTAVRQRIRDILMRSTLESYSWVQSVHGHPFVHSPLPLIKNFVLEQPAAFRRQHLLPGLPTNHSSMASLVTFLRAMVKHERTHMRNIILTNVRQEHRVRELGAVPKLLDLIVLLDRAFQPRTTMRSFQEIQADVTLGVRVRIAMLRLLTIHHLVHRAPGDTRSQWDLIDDHLEALREKSPLEMAVYSVLILRRDRELFPGNTMFGDVPAELIQLPNALESDIEMRAMVSELGPEPSDEQLTTSLAREVTLDE